MFYTHEIFSGISGSISLACWVFVLAPQLFENYRSKSADGISLAFLIVWLVILSKLLPSDSYLILSCENLRKKRDLLRPALRLILLSKGY